MKSFLIGLFGLTLFPAIGAVCQHPLDGHPVVGVLVEVPVMLSVVRIVLRTRGWYEHARTV